MYPKRRASADQTNGFVKAGVLRRRDHESPAPNETARAPLHECLHNLVEDLFGWPDF